MTSANVIEYSIFKGKKEVGNHRQNIMCKEHWEDLLQYQPLNIHKIRAFGYNEEDEYWQEPPRNLLLFLLDVSKFNNTLYNKVLNSMIRDEYKDSTANRLP